jgi:hypothetical protein
MELINRNDSYSLIDDPAAALSSPLGGIVLLIGEHWIFLFPFFILPLPLDDLLYQK